MKIGRMTKFFENYKINIKPIRKNTRKDDNLTKKKKGFVISKPLQPDQS